MLITLCRGNDKDYQRLLNNFLKDIFLDFQFWYDLDLWDENYESYSIIKCGEIISNVCVYKTMVAINGSQHLALSLGAIATKKSERKKGFSRLLLEHVIAKYEGTPMYLWANDKVRDFYPKFGFKQLEERLPTVQMVINNKIKPRRLHYKDPMVWKYVSNRINYSPQFDCLNTVPINLFHIHWGYLKDSLYHIPELKTLVVAQQQGTILKLKGVFSLQQVQFYQLVEALPFTQIDKIEFGFMPYWPELLYTMEREEGDPFFGKDLIWLPERVKFPELSST